MWINTFGSISCRLSCLSIRQYLYVFPPVWPSVSFSVLILMTHLSPLISPNTITQASVIIVGEPFNPLSFVLDVGYGGGDAIGRGRGQQATPGPIINVCKGQRGTLVAGGCSLSLRSLVIFNALPASAYTYPVLSPSSPSGKGNWMGSSAGSSWYATGGEFQDDATSAQLLVASLGSYMSLLWALGPQRNYNYSGSTSPTWSPTASPVLLNNVTLVLPPVELQV